MVKKVLIIGAGASVGARSHLHITPPLGLQLLTYLKNSSQLLALENNRLKLCETWHITTQVLSILNSINGDNFEKEILKLTSEDRDLIHRFLAIMFCDLSKDNLDLGFNAITDKYDDIANIILSDNKSDWSIISLNYDLLFETALQRNNVAFHFANMPRGIKINDVDGIPIYKPHGSINFYSKPDIHVSYGKPLDTYPMESTKYQDLGSGHTSVEFPHCFAGGISSKDVIMRSTDKTLSLVITNYAENKFSDFNFSALEKIRVDAVKTIEAAQQVYICGINPSITKEDDPFLFGSFQNLKANSDKLTICAYSEIDRTVYSELFPEAKIINGSLNELNSNFKY